MSSFLVLCFGFVCSLNIKWNQIIKEAASPEAEIATFQFETYRQNIWLNENNCVSRTGYKRSIIWIFMVKPADYFNLKEQVKSF